MRGEPIKQRNRLKGYMFEIAILKLIKQNGFERIEETDAERVREQRERFIELRGRGTWHQIDCPCDYSTMIPFIYPIRMLGEVKFFSNPIEKQHIREFIGVIKDIQENYFVPENYTGPLERFTEIGVFFSAAGFAEEAERLAFAHNIKTVSYKNNYLIDNIKEDIEELERNYLEASKCISTGNLNDFTRIFSDVLDGGVDEFFRALVRFNPAEGFYELVRELSQSFTLIKSSFIANTSGGAFIHFLGSDEFPAELFDGSDEQDCRVFYLEDNRKTYFYLVFTNDGRERRFYFTPPTSLSMSVFYGRAATLNAKEEIFKTVHVSMKINNVNRNLVFSLDNDWLEGLRNEM